MPQVPEYRSQVGSNLLSGARVSGGLPLEALGGGPSGQAVTEAGMQLNNEAAKIIQEERHKAIEAATTDAYTKLVQSKQSLLWDTKEGALSKKGEDSFGIVDPYNEKFKNAYDGIDKDLHDPEAKRLFNKMYAREQVDFDGHMQRHIYTEKQHYDTEKTGALTETMQQEAIKNWYVPGKVDDSVRIIKYNLQRYAQANGKSPEWLAQNTEKQVSATHKGVIQNIMSGGQDLQGKDYYKKNKDYLTGEDDTQVKALLETGSANAEGDRRAARMMDKGVTLNNLQQELDKISDEKVKRATKQSYVDRMQLQDAAEKQAHNATFQSAMEAVLNKDQSPGPRNPAYFLGIIPPEVQNQLDEKELKVVQDLYYNNNVVTDPKVNYALEAMAAKDPKTFKETDLRLLYPYLSPPDRAKWAKMQGQANKGTGAELDELQSRAAVRDQVLFSEFGVDIRTKNAKDQQKLSEIKSSIDQQISVYKDQTGKKATNDDVRAITRQLMTQVVTDKGIIYNERKRIYELKPGTPVELETSKIPPVERAKIEAALKKGNIAITDENVKQVYQTQLNKLAPRAY